jgi:hypothetical protein
MLKFLSIDPPVKVLEKEERLELKAESAKNNGHVANGKRKKSTLPEPGHGDDPALVFTGKYVAHSRPILSLFIFNILFLIKILRWSNSRFKT